MKKEKLKKLYHQQILEKNKNPYHFEKCEETAEHCLAYNPICGDKFTLYLDRDDEKMNSAYFYGFGCALSKASTSVLMEKIEGMSNRDIQVFCQMFLDAVKGNKPLSDSDQAMETLVELRHYEGRRDCITLSWRALLNHLARKGVEKT